MKTMNLAGTGLLFTGLLAMPTLAAPKTCAAGAATPESYKWNFRKEASKLLEGVRDQAYLAEDNAATLNSLSSDPGVTWQAHADQLHSLRAEVDAMGEKLCRLEVIRQSTAPWEQKAIDDAAPLIRYIADNTEAAIRYLREHADDPWTPTYRVYTSNVEKGSTQLQKRVGEYLHLAKLGNEELQLRKQVQTPRPGE